MISRKDLLNKPYSVVENWYSYGVVSTVDWEWFRHVWRNSVFRFSHLAQDTEHKTETERAACRDCNEARGDRPALPLHLAT